MPALSTMIYRLTAFFLAVLMLTNQNPPAQAQEQTAETEKTTQRQFEPIVRLENLTWTQVKDAINAGTTTIIIPTGGTEQNGAHMVLGKHNYIVSEAARAIAQRLGNALVAPVMAYVPQGDPTQRTGHMAYPGTISLTPDIFEKVLEQAATSFKTHGFKTIVFLGDSGGNQASQARVADQLNSRWRNSGVRVIHLSDYYARSGGEALLLESGETKATIGTHAGIRDTAELMAVFPAGVDLSRATPDADGASGDATRATRSLGRKLLQGKVDAAITQLKRLTRKQSKTANPRPEKSTGIIPWLYGVIFG